MATLRIVLFAFGYVTATAVIARFTRVVRGRHFVWLVVHHLAVAGIVAGWAIGANWPAVAVNSAWLVASTAWYVVAGRRRPVRQG